MDTVLAGQDGTTPAIDANTGQPLTIEELLRRRGLLAVNGSTRVNGQAPTVQASTTGEGSVIDNSMDASTGENTPMDADANGASVVPATIAAAMANRSSNGAIAARAVSPSATGIAGDSSSFDPTALLGIGGVGAAAGLGYALANRRKKAKGAGPDKLKGGNSNPSPKPGAPAGGAASSSREIATMPGTAPKQAVRQQGMIAGTRQIAGPIPDAEFSEVNPLVKVLTDKRVIKALTRIK